MDRISHNSPRKINSSCTDPVQIESGFIAGTLAGEPDNAVHVYRGIPYAALPIRELRWKPPQPVDRWVGIRECTVFSSIQPQPIQPLGPKLAVAQDEDCLYLNVLTPALKTSQKLPVMVWMHGGGYWAGNGNEAMSNNIKLPQQGVVLVTVNTRLGSLGLLAHPLLSQESSRGVSGNYMFLDMVAALQWVQKNIAAFGGNPHNVTIFGESGGGGKVSALIASPLAGGLFQRAICESGAAFPPVSPGIPLKEMEMIGKRLFLELGVDKEKDPLATARALPWQKILEADAAISREMNVQLGLWDATIDDWFLPDAAVNIFQKGQQNAVSLITCANRGELKGPGNLLMPWIIPIYTSMLASESKAGAKVFACIFDQVPAGWRQEGCVSCHAIELPYVFGTVDVEQDWINLLPIAGPSGAKTKTPAISDTDRKVSAMMMSMWAQFARTGDPSVTKLIKWPVWEQNTDQYLYINDILRVKSGFSKLSDQPKWRKGK
jgi:para-nitrobenzyl esterase